MKTFTPESLAVAFLTARIGKERLMSRIVLTVEANSKRVTPVLTGNLKRSITSRVEAAGERGVVGTNASYARFVHDGTSRMAPRPFFTNGMGLSRDSINGFMDDELAQVVKGIA